MRKTRLMMGMPITAEIVGPRTDHLLEQVFDYFDAVDQRFSPYSPDSEITAFNTGRLHEGELSTDMREVMALAEATKLETGGYFDIRRPDGRLDPSGIVKGWAIRNAARIIEQAGQTDYFVDAGGDIQSAGRNAKGMNWRVGVRNPFVVEEIIKVVVPLGAGVATSGSYFRGPHIYNPHRPEKALDDILSLTVIAQDVLEADRMATAAFAMGRAGLDFLESLPGFEAYGVDANKRAIQTSGLEGYCA
jgi:FAD:protein FMN transferase